MTTKVAAMTKVNENPFFNCRAMNCDETKVSAQLFFLLSDELFVLIYHDIGRLYFADDQFVVVDLI